MISIGVSTIHHYRENTMKIECGCHCIKCKSTDLEVIYGEKCPVCDVRIDEYGFCSCGSNGD